MLASIPFYTGLIKADLGDGKKAANSHVLVFGAIAVHDMGEKGCIVSNSKLSLETGVSKSRVEDILTELTKAGWIQVHMKDGKRTKIVPLLTIGKIQEGGFLPVGRGVPADRNIDNSLGNTPTESIAAGDKSTKEKENETLRLFFLVVKQYGLAPQNRNHYKKWAAELEQTLKSAERAGLYLNRLLERDLNAERDRHPEELTPTLNVASDILYKCQKIIRYYNRTMDAYHG